MKSEHAHISEIFEDLQLLENFVPKINKNGQAKLAFVEAIPMLIEKNGEEIPKLQFRFICEGANESRPITYTGWLKESFTKNSKLGQIIEGFNLYQFPETKAEVVEDFDFEDNFKKSESSSTRISFPDLMTKLADLEGVLLLAKLEKEKDIWHRPDPTTFEFPRDKKGDYFRADVSEFKQN